MARLIYRVCKLCKKWPANRIADSEDLCIKCLTVKYAIDSDTLLQKIARLFCD